MLLLPLLAFTSHTLRILFVGNSLLNFNDVPLTVGRLLESSGFVDRVVTRSYFVGHLEDVAPGTLVDREVGSGNYDIVVLQSAMVSSSLSRTYAQTRGIAMTRSALAHHARVLLYVEWPRRGIDETEYTMNVYRGIARDTKAEIVPVCYAWNAALVRKPQLNLWMPDGNHAQVAGSFLAATSVFVHIAGLDKTPTYRPLGIDADFAQLALEASRSAETRVVKTDVG